MARIEGWVGGRVGRIDQAVRGLRSGGDRRGQAMLAVLAVATVSAASAALAGFAPHAAGPVAVFVSPLSPPGSAERLVEAARGSVVRATGMSSVVIARSDDPGFEARLRAAGAVAVVAASEAPAF